MVFAGRLSAEKGVEDLLEAWLRWGPSAPELRLIGDGPLRSVLELRAASISNIKLLGQLSSHEAQKEIASARLLVLPSHCFEGFPMVLREAFALGTPVLVSNLGPLPEIVRSAKGVVFPAGDVNALGHELSALWSDKEQLAAMATKSRTTFKHLYTEEINYHQLMEIYETAAANAADLQMEFSR